MENSTAKRPPVLPQFMGIVRAIKNINNPIPMVHSYMKKYGTTYGFNPIGGVAEFGITSADPDFIQHVLQKNNKNYRKSKIVTHTLGGYIGNGLLTSEGDYWLKQRRLIQPGFHRKKIAALIEIMNTAIEETIQILDEAASTGDTIDIYKEMMHLAFKIVARSIFSTSMNEEEVQRLDEVISGVQEMVIKQIRQPYLHWYFKLNGMLDRCQALSDDAGEILMKYIKARREDPKKYDDLLDMLLSSKYEDTGEGMTDQQVLDEALILFVAGHETSANAMTWMWHLLSKHPQYVTQLRQEIDEKLGGEAASFENLPLLSFNKQVINEAMRMYPPAWIVDRFSKERDEVNGIEIPKNSLIVMFIYGVHHSKEIWGDPEIFRPERFDLSHKKDRHNYAFMPFGGGPRLCIGNSFAMMEMQLALNKIVQRFDFETIPNQKIELQPLITLRPKYGIKMKVKRS